MIALPGTGRKGEDRTILTIMKSPLDFTVSPSSSRATA
jgi:hypothetical protein